MVLLVGGGAFAYRTYRLSRPIHPVLLQFPVPAETSLDERDATAKAVGQKLRDPALLVRVSKDVGLKKKLRYATDEAAASDLGKRLFVEAGEVDTAQGRKFAINIGLNCTVGEYNTMVEVSQHLNQVFKIP